ncbi:serine/threonine-protein kinase phg2-like [Ruditapes philippinarum]|uniref:serine/threonine-protein kinase phg2-like n=1 Tax=Ruditapes philippinarum TaxID=129788 RepID=UPI00295BE014|nr:serine/threonine-protein kinase phg2-like [Ruditapes philippinarum]
MSEKCPAKKKGTKTRQYETEDMDKHCLAEVSVDNYDGAGKIVAYCVDATGKLHPYNLFGDQCNRGVYVVRFRFRQGKVARLYKVSVTTPKAKEYKENLKNQLSYLTEVGIQDIKFCTPEEIQDKQIVYVMFRVILDNGDILTKISTALQNKKKGKEFKIEDVEPVCCPANMPVDCVNPWKHRIMLHVTEGTAFPSDVGLKIRERDSNKKIVWEAEPDTFHTIKQCVVKFVPPPYRDPETKKDVEVEICLYDKATKNETEPFKFIYKGLENVKPEMNFDHKAKKRKLMDDIDMASTSFSPDVRGERKTLTALRSRPNSSSSGSSNGSSAENSLTYQESQPLFESAQNRSATPTGVEEGAVSLREQQQGNGQIPFQNYSGQNPGQSIFGASNGQSSRPQSAGFRGQMTGTGMQASSNQTSIVTSTTSVFCTTTTATTSYVSPELPTMSVNSSRENTASNNQIQPEATEQHPGVMVLSEEDKHTLDEQGVQLPELGPKQMYALIGGQIYVVNDDTAEQSSNVTQTPAPYNSPATSTVTQTPAPYNSQANVQNIGQLQVVIQQFAPQQPASEAEQRQVEFPPMTSGISQSMGAQNFPMSTASMSTAVDQSAVLQQQRNVLMQQQQQEQLLQQQQLQQLLQQPQVYQQIAQVALQAGLDPTDPVVLQQLLQQISALQGQTSLQQGNAAEATMFGAGADLNDDDLEEDGGSVSTKNASKNKTNKPMSVVKAGDRRNKKLRGSSGIGKAMYEAEHMEYVEGEIDDDTRIPVFVNEVTIGEESNDCDTNNKVQSVKTVHYKMKNGSFGNDISSDEGESR